jgi:cation:H+ antiporter
MITKDIFIFFVAIAMVLKGATMATKYAVHLAQSFKLSKYTIGFIVIAIISVLPETFIALSSSVQGVPSFGLGMLFGSNIADLTLVFAAIILLTGRSLKVESKILKNHNIYPFLLFLPLVLGFDGYFSRPEGLTLIIAGGIFYYLSLKNGMVERTISLTDGSNRFKNSMMLLVSMAILLVGSHFIVTSASSFAYYLGINPILVGMLIVGLGTTIPEFFFSLKSARRQDDSLAIGDILGTVLADATVVVGILALLNPFFFPPRIIYVTGVFMLIASLVLFHFMRSGRTLSKKESYWLIIFWLIFVIVEFIANK